MPNRPRRSQRTPAYLAALRQKAREEAVHDPWMARMIAEHPWLKDDQPVPAGAAAAPPAEMSAAPAADADFPTTVVGNSNAEDATTYPSPAGIFPPPDPVFGLGGGKIDDSSPREGLGIMTAESTEAMTGPGVTAGGELAVVNQRQELSARISHQLRETGGGKIADEGEALVVTGETPDQSLVVPKRQLRRGRPRTVDDAMQTKILSLMAAGLSLRQTAAKVGVHHTTIMDAMLRDRDFAEQVSEARTEGITQPLAVVIKAARTNWRAAAWLAKHLQAQLYHLDCPPEERALQDKKKPR